MYLPSCNRVVGLYPDTQYILYKQYLNEELFIEHLSFIELFLVHLFGSNKRETAKPTGLKVHMN